MLNDTLIFFSVHFSETERYGSFHANVNMKTANFRWFLTVYCIPELSSLLGVKGAKHIGPHGGLQVGKTAVPDK